MLEADNKKRATATDNNATMHDDKNDRDDNELYVFQDSQQQLDLQQQ
jgi:hypothetical protein